MRKLADSRKKWTYVHLTFKKKQAVSAQKHMPIQVVFSTQVIHLLLF